LAAWYIAIPHGAEHRRFAKQIRKTTAVDQSGNKSLVASPSAAGH